ncbi:MAG TPA: type II toxin-antitoxin system HicB family antitoxin [Chloroflexota bacterium]|nr:type II toxin-antitoxin system HicB family antitoxin [Chloroflexota bacterium]
MSTYVILIERAEDGGYGAWCPDLSGCVALGDTHAQCVAEMHDAIALHLDGLRAAGQPVPAPTAIAADTVNAA